MGCTTSIDSEPTKVEIKTVNVVKRKKKSKEEIKSDSHYNRYTGVITINKFPKYGIRSLLNDI